MAAPKPSRRPVEDVDRQVAALMAAALARQAAELKAS